MLAKRIIPCLDIDCGRVVKGICFAALAASLFHFGQYKIAEVKSCLKANGVFGKMTPAIEDLKYDERA